MNSICRHIWRSARREAVMSPGGPSLPGPDAGRLWVGPGAPGKQETIRDAGPPGTAGAQHCARQEAAPAERHHLSSATPRARLSGSVLRAGSPSWPTAGARSPGATSLSVSSAKKRGAHRARRGANWGRSRRGVSRTNRPGRTESARARADYSLQSALRRRAEPGRAEPGRPQPMRGPRAQPGAAGGAGPGGGAGGSQSASPGSRAGCGRGASGAGAREASPETGRSGGGAAAAREVPVLPPRAAPGALDRGRAAGRAGLGRAPERRGVLRPLLLAAAEPQPEPESPPPRPRGSRDPSHGFRQLPPHPAPVHLREEKVPRIRARPAGPGPQRGVGDRGRAGRRCLRQSLQGEGAAGVTASRPGGRAGAARRT